MSNIDQELANYISAANSALFRALPDKSATPKQLHDAMHYVIFNGGKRIRPVLVYATGHALGAKNDQLHAAAAAIEMIHTYSLVHDDLPAMDDDDLRRGKATCHIAYDEATAILAGDALLTHAFEVIGREQDNVSNADIRLELTQILAKASGTFGMVGGQAIDLAAVGKSLTLDELQDMHRRKTGALIQASLMLGATVAKANLLQTENLIHYANCIGLAFQIRDDILDVEGDTSVIGKAQGADIARNKPTYPALMGMDAAKEKAQSLHHEAMDALANFDHRADTLRSLSAYIVERDK